jgi:hypothetical protein
MLRWLGISISLHVLFFQLNRGRSTFSDNLATVTFGLAVVQSTLNKGKQSLRIQFNFGNITMPLSSKIMTLTLLNFKAIENDKM